jgi:hypothetical protein
MKIRNLVPTTSTGLRAGAALAGTLALATAVDGRCAGLLDPTGISITGGYGSHVAVYGVAAHWDSLCPSAWLKDHGLDTRLNAELAYWHSRRDRGGHAGLVDASLTPLLRWSGKRDGSSRAFVEGGVGIQVLSHTRIDDRQLGLAVQFGEQLGAGFAFGPRDRYEAGVYVRHVSNAGIKEPNYGLTYFGAILRMQL